MLKDTFYRLALCTKHGREEMATKYSESQLMREKGTWATFIFEWSPGGGADSLGAGGTLENNWRQIDRHQILIGLGWNQQTPYK